jgi:hypothetical protein
VYIVKVFVGEANPSWIDIVVVVVVVIIIVVVVIIIIILLEVLLKPGSSYCRLSCCCRFTSGTYEDLGLATARP